MQPTSHSRHFANDSHLPSRARHISHASTRPTEYSVPHMPRHLEYADGAELQDEGREVIRKKPSRRARLKRRAVSRIRRMTLWEGVGVVVSLGVSVLLVGQIVQVQSRYVHFRSQVQDQQAQLDSLEQQKNDEQGRLARLKTPAGHDEMLMARGYVKPGDRILLLPDNKKNDSPPESN